MKTKFNWAALMLALVLALSATGCVSYTESETFNGHTTTRRYGTPSFFGDRSANTDPAAFGHYEVAVTNGGTIPVDIVSRNGDVLLEYLAPGDTNTATIRDTVVRAVPHRSTDRGDYKVAVHDCAGGTAMQEWTVNLQRQ